MSVKSPFSSHGPILPNQLADPQITYLQTMLGKIRGYPIWLQCLSRCHTLMKQKFNSGSSVGESRVNLALLCVFYVQQLRSKYFNCHLSIKRKVFIYTRRLTSYVGIHWDTHIALNTSAIPPIPAAHLLCKTTCRRAEVKIYDFDSNHRWRSQKAIREWHW